jgi:predicted enzyme related to lactoylglutathione lyase
MSPFFRYQLRTTDVEAARAFYARVLGYEDASVVPLHEQALARGARPHWLGFIDVTPREVDATVAAFATRGAQPLGPKWINPEGLEAAVMRDPGGAVVALARPPQPHQGGSAHDIAWHLLNTPDVESAKANYTELFGWHFFEPLAVAEGVVHPFAWQPGAPSGGAFYDIAARPAVHPHWLFHFRTASLTAALEAVQSSGGTALGPLSLPNGATIAVCDDPQGAAFALVEMPNGKE